MSNLSPIPYALDVPEMHIQCAEQRKLTALQVIAQNLLDAHNPQHVLAGVHVMTEGGWWMVRAATSHPALIVRAQAFSKAGLVRIKRDLANQFDNACLDFPLSKMHV